MRPALAILSGLLLAGAFPKWNLGPLAFVALVPLLVALKPSGFPRTRVVPLRRAFGLGYLSGVAFFLALLYWIPFLPSENVTIPFFMYPALALMAAYLSLYPALAALGSAWLGRRGIPLGLSFPPFWVLGEWTRSTGTFGFPWGDLGYALAWQPRLIQFADVTGMWGVGLWVAAVNGLVHALFERRAGRSRILVAAGLVVCFAGPLLYGRHALRDREPGETVRVGVVQPNVGKEKWRHGVRDSVVTALVDHSRALALSTIDDPPRIIVWPETAVPARLPRETPFLRQVERLVDETGVPVLAGYPDGEVLEDGSWFITNSAGLLEPGKGIVRQYNKRHLVPFSEYFPLPVLNRVDFGQSNFTPGKIPGVMRDLDVPFGVLICFESIFPGAARDLANDGARFLVNITNDQWFGDSAAPEQHFAMNVLRVIETRMGMVRSANTGISAILDPRGNVVERTPTFVDARFAGDVELGGSPTIYARTGDWVLWLALAALLAEGGYAVLFGKRR